MSHHRLPSAAGSSRPSGRFPIDTIPGTSIDRGRAPWPRSTQIDPVHPRWRLAETPAERGRATRPRSSRRLIAGSKSPEFALVIPPPHRTTRWVRTQPESGSDKAPLPWVGLESNAVSRGCSTRPHGLGNLWDALGWNLSQRGRRVDRPRGSSSGWLEEMRTRPQINRAPVVRYDGGEQRLACDHG
jgi:hypothetical protein